MTSRRFYDKIKDKREDNNANDYNHITSMTILYYSIDIYPKRRKRWNLNKLQCHVEGLLVKTLCRDFNCKGSISLATKGFTDD